MPERWTDEETEAFGLVLLGRWPTAVSAWGRSGLAAFVTEVQADGVDPKVAVRAARAHTSDFPPSASSISRMAERLVQGAPPTFGQFAAAVCRHVCLMDYFRPSKGFDVFVARLSEEHEIMGRMAVQLGPKGCNMMPDPAGAISRDQSYRVGQLERELREVVAEWEADPARGVALQEAQRMAGVVTSGARSAITAARAEIEAGR